VGIPALLGGGHLLGREQARLECGVLVAGKGDVPAHPRLELPDPIRGPADLPAQLLLRLLEPLEPLLDLPELLIDVGGLLRPVPPEHLVDGARQLRLHGAADALDPQPIAHVVEHAGLLSQTGQGMIGRPGFTAFGCWLRTR
jgi:hypothetical protein